MTSTKIEVDGCYKIKTIPGHTKVYQVTAIRSVWVEVVIFNHRGKWVGRNIITLAAFKKMIDCRVKPR